MADEQTIDGLGDPEDKAPPQPPIEAKGLRKLVRIILNDDENIPPTGQPFSINGRAYILRPGEEADVPEEIIEVLDNAVITKPILEPGTRRVVGWRDQLRFGYRRV